MNPALISTCKAQIQRLLEAYPALADDEDFRRDVIEGETDFNRLLERLVREFHAKRHSIAAHKDWKKEIDNRCDKEIKRSIVIRETIASLMEAADLQSIKLVAGSLSMVPTPQAVIVSDEGILPPEFTRTKTEPDRAAIKKAIEEGVIVPGASLSNGGTTLRIA